MKIVQTVCEMQELLEVQNPFHRQPFRSCQYSFWFTFLMAFDPIDSQV